jgi:hypothetical protein
MPASLNAGISLEASNLQLEAALFTDHQSSAHANPPTAVAS